MATVEGTESDDFIHQAGDGLTPPPGFNEVTGVTSGPDLILAGAGTDIVHAGSGDDIISVSQISHVSGLSERRVWRRLTSPDHGGGC